MPIGVNPSRRDASQELVAVLNVENEDAMPAVLQVIPNPGHGYVEKLLLNNFVRGTSAKQDVGTKDQKEQIANLRLHGLIIAKQWMLDKRLRSRRLCLPERLKHWDMEPNDLRKRLQGVIGFPVTPFNPDLSLNLDGLRSNVRAMAKHPLCAIVAPAGTGELYSLSPAEHLAVVNAAIEEAKGRVPVLAGTGFNPPIAAELARQAARAGASGILAFPPYYPSPDDDGIVAYYKSIAEATSLGILIYTRDWFNPSPALVERLTQIPKLIGWKDGQADIRRYQMIRERVGERLHWIGGAGDDIVPGYYSMGIRTYTSSIANVAPRLSLRLHALASRGHSEELTKLMEDLVVPLYVLRARRKGYEVSVMKAMMDIIGLVGGPVRPPLVDLRAEETQELRAMLKRWGEWLD